MIRFYNDMDLGTFEYDTSDFEVHRVPMQERNYLKYVGSGNNIVLPKGCIDCSYMFSEYEGEYLDLSEFDTRGVVSMHCMFSDSEYLKYLDLSNFDTSEVLDMHSMFYRCTRLRKVDVSSFNTKNVLSMYCMFSDCYSLRALDLSNFDMSRVETTEMMFASCIRLKALALSNFKLSHNVDDFLMFQDCVLKYLETREIDFNKRELERVGLEWL